MLSQSSGDRMQDFLREEVLRLTSDLRLSLERLHHEPKDTGALARARRAGRAIAETGSQARLRSLMRCGKAYEDVLAANCGALDGDVARRTFDGLHGALGLVEQLLDWSIEAADEPRQERLCRALQESLARSARFDATAASPPEEPAPEEEIAAAPAPTSPAAESATAGPTLNDFEREMTQVFSAEAGERLARCEELLLQLEPDPGNADLLQQVLREFHTLKGSAAATGLKAVAEQLHTGESVLDAVARGAKVLDGGKLVDLLLKVVDAVKVKLRQGPATAPSPSDLSLEIARLLQPTARTTGARAAAVATPEVDTNVVRVESGRLAALMQEVGELVASGTDLDQQIGSLNQLREKLGPGELSDQLGAFIQSLESRAQQLTRITSGLQEQVSHLQFLPLEVVFRRLLRPVRDAAHEEGKLVELEFAGGDLRLDRSVVEALYAPLLHLVRNSVAHGIETPEARQASGKPQEGSLRISAAPGEEGWVVVSVVDDGSGLDLKRILLKARALGLVAPEASPSRDEVCRLIFRPGFSTRDAVTEISGRGVGMDVVEKRIQALGGTVEVESRDGAGTTIRLRVPIASPTMDVIVLAVGRGLYAVPGEVVSDTLPVAVADLERSGGALFAVIDGHRVRVTPLGRALGEPEPAEEGEIVLLRCAPGTAAFLVDAARDRRDAPMRPASRGMRSLIAARASTEIGEIQLLDVEALLELSGENGRLGAANGGTA